MFDKLLLPVVNYSGKALANGAKAVGAHLTKHGAKYVAGAAAAVVTGVAYTFGKIAGHEEGKKEGTIEQAARDEKKMRDMQQKHEDDRNRWSKQRQEYEDFLNESVK